MRIASFHGTTWRVTWRNGPTGSIQSVDLESPGIVTLTTGETHEIAGISPVNPQHWPLVNKLLSRYEKEQTA